MIYAKITGTGSYVPKKKVTNYDLEKFLDTNNDWIVDRTGIHNRHIASKEESNAYMACEAAKKAIGQRINSDEIDLIIVATTTPDHIFPSTACMVQGMLGAKNAFVMDVQAVCSGFLYALSIAEMYIVSKKCANAIVIGSDVISKILDWKDRSTCVLFGDGAGAFFLESSEKKGIIRTNLYSDGSLYDILYVKRPDNVIIMNGREVFKHAVSKMQSSIEKILLQTGLSINDISWFAPHQANDRIVSSIRKNLNVPHEKVIKSIDRYANTAAASIPMLLDDAIKMGTVKAGDLILSAAAGGGFTWGASLFYL